MAQVGVRVPLCGSFVSGNQITSRMSNLLMQARTSGKKGGISFPSHNITYHLLWGKFPLSLWPLALVHGRRIVFLTLRTCWRPWHQLSSSRTGKQTVFQTTLARQLFRSKATSSSPAILQFPPIASLRTLTQPWWEVRVSLDNLVFWFVEVNLGEVHDFSW